MSTTAVVKDLGEIYTRLFSPRPFLQSEIGYFVREFEDKRRDREVENLFTTLQNTTEIRDCALQRCATLGSTHLPELKASVLATTNECHHVLQASSELAIYSAGATTSTSDRFEPDRQKNRRQRAAELDQFAADVQHKRGRIDNTFEEKEEELREFYTDLACKLRGNV